MDIERPHRTTSTPTTTSELFICFTSRLSKSSSMRLSSKSILSPGRTTNAADKSAQPLSLSTSLSRRLRHNGSLRGGQSPAMFPSKKSRGSSGFADNPEPSSPKVTCIGQVRVKTKKQGKKMKMRACRSKRLSGGEASFRRIEHPHDGLTQGMQTQQSQECGLNHRNQRWVHLPLTICEALRAFGNEFSCLFPCKSSCFSSGSVCGVEKGGKTGEERESGANSCAVFRWLVSLQEGEDEGKRRDIELVVGGEEEVERQDRGESIMMERECSRRRSIFDDMEFDDLFNNVKNEEGENDNENDEEGGGRVSICIPPKNALLLMRCRSDPMKMASLSHKLWEAPLPHDDKAESDLKLEEKIEVCEEEREEFVEGSEQVDEMVDVWLEAESNLEGLPCYVGEEQNQEEKLVETEQNQVEKLVETEQNQEEKLVETEQNHEEKLVETEQNQEEQLVETEQNLEEKLVETEQNEEEQLVEIQQNQEEKLVETEQKQGGEQLCEIAQVVKDETSTVQENEQELSVKKEEERESEVIVEKSNPTLESSDLSTTTTSSSSNSSEESTAESKQKEVEQARKSMEEERETLPDCLLLMMCEPKVSMEVSKETWVCSTDFLQWLPERHPKKVGNKLDASDDSSKKKKPPPVQQSVQRSEPAPRVQPARSSISFPAGGGSVANLIEQKLVKGGSGGYEPLVLTRCKSAPMRSAAAKIAPSEMTCSLWGRENGRKLEPHRPATFGVGAAGFGF